MERPVEDGVLDQKQEVVVGVESAGCDARALGRHDPSELRLEANEIGVVPEELSTGPARVVTW